MCLNLGFVRLFPLLLSFIALFLEILVEIRFLLLELGITALSHGLLNISYLLATHAVEISGKLRDSFDLILSDS